MAAYGQDLPKRGLLDPHVESDDLERKKPLPKTLKGRPFELFRQIQHRQEKCPYGILIQYYCPSKDSPLFSNEQSLPEISCNVVEEGGYGMQESVNFLHNTTRYNQVAAFVKSVVQKLLPAKTFGSRTNWNIILRHIDTYISLGRYEKLTMHGLIQGISVRDITWLGKYDCAKMPLGEYNKRTNILSEFVYWLFDSLIPSIVRGNFFVTDSATTRNRLVYFRHDVWHRLSQPALNQIISTMFDEIPIKLLKTIAEDKTRKLGFAGIRLLPKATGVRLIMRLNKAGLRKGVLGSIAIPKMSKSINQAMKPVFQVLQHEYSVNKEALGSAILGTTDALPKLLEFQKALKDQGLLGRNLYFVKVDIQSCFDSIPPAQAYRAAKKFFRLNEYRIRQFIMVSMKNNDVFKRFISAAYPGPLEDSLEVEYDPMENSEFSLFVKRTVKNFENKIFIDGAKVTFYERHELLRLLVEHIAGHIVQKIL
ncbi:Telomerase ribonucleoprotein complex RNA binding domain-containing protein [Lipomyces doorenjongii]|uniref:Telomerase ribonucleoprotein complex RNA binding domain-containing protein n=1 Tax=Lipomyces doorenjongii TaxID=383834 RepID=UPI0034CF470A